MHQPILFPELQPEPPRRAEEVWAAVDTWRAKPGKRLVRPTQVDLARILDYDPKTIQRAHHDMPDLVPWPILPHMQRPWLEHSELLLPEHTTAEDATAAANGGAAEEVDGRQLRFEVLNGQLTPMLGPDPVQLIAADGGGLRWSLKHGDQAP